MSKQTNGATVPGTKAPLLTKESIEQLLDRDLQVIANLIRTLQDPSVKAYLADYLCDRYHATKHPSDAE